MRRPIAIITTIYIIGCDSNRLKKIASKTRSLGPSVYDTIDYEAKGSVSTGIGAFSTGNYVSLLMYAGCNLSTLYNTMNKNNTLNPRTSTLQSTSSTSSNRGPLLSSITSGMMSGHTTSDHYNPYMSSSTTTPTSPVPNTGRNYLLERARAKARIHDEEQNENELHERAESTRMKGRDDETFSQHTRSARQPTALDTMHDREENEDERKVSAGAIDMFKNVGEYAKEEVSDLLHTASSGAKKFTELMSILGDAFMFDPNRHNVDTSTEKMIDEYKNRVQDTQTKAAAILSLGKPSSVEDKKQLNTMRDDVKKSTLDRLKLKKDIVEHVKKINTKTSKWVDDIKSTALSKKTTSEEKTSSDDEADEKTSRTSSIASGLENYDPRAINMFANYKPVSEGRAIPVLPQTTPVPDFDDMIDKAEPEDLLAYAVRPDFVMMSSAFGSSYRPTTEDVGELIDSLYDLQSVRRVITSRDGAKIIVGSSGTPYLLSQKDMAIIADRKDYAHILNNIMSFPKHNDLKYLTKEQIKSRLKPKAGLHGGSRQQFTNILDGAQFMLSIPDLYSSVSHGEYNSDGEWIDRFDVTDIENNSPTSIRDDYEMDTALSGCDMKMKNDDNVIADSLISNFDDVNTVESKKSQELDEPLSEEEDINRSMAVYNKFLNDTLDMQSKKWVKRWDQSSWRQSEDWDYVNSRYRSHVIRKLNEDVMYKNYVDHHVIDVHKKECLLSFRVKGHKSQVNSTFQMNIFDTFRVTVKQIFKWIWAIHKEEFEDFENNYTVEGFSGKIQYKENGHWHYLTTAQLKSDAPIPQVTWFRVGVYEGLRGGSDSFLDATVASGITAAMKNDDMNVASTTSAVVMPVSESKVFSRDAQFKGNLFMDGVGVFEHGVSTSNNFNSSPWAYGIYYMNSLYALLAKEDQTIATRYKVPAINVFDQQLFNTTVNGVVLTVRESWRSIGTRPQMGQSFLLSSVASSALASMSSPNMLTVNSQSIVRLGYGTIQGDIFYKVLRLFPNGFPATDSFDLNRIYTTAVLLAQTRLQIPLISNFNIGTLDNLTYQGGACVMNVTFTNPFPNSSGAPTTVVANATYLSSFLSEAVAETTAFTGISGRGNWGLTTALVPISPEWNLDADELNIYTLFFLSTPFKWISSDTYQGIGGPNYNGLLTYLYNHVLMSGPTNVLYVIMDTSTTGGTLSNGTVINAVPLAGNQVTITATLTNSFATVNSQAGLNAYNVAFQMLCKILPSNMALRTALFTVASLMYKSEGRNLNASNSRDTVCALTVLNARYTAPDYNRIADVLNRQYNVYDVPGLSTAGGVPLIDNSNVDDLHMNRTNYLAVIAYASRMVIPENQQDTDSLIKSVYLGPNSAAQVWASVMACAIDCAYEMDKLALTFGWCRRLPFASSKTQVWLVPLYVVEIERTFNAMMRRYGITHGICCEWYDAMTRPTYDGQVTVDHRNRVTSIFNQQMYELKGDSAYFSPINLDNGNPTLTTVLGNNTIMLTKWDHRTISNFDRNAYIMAIALYRAVSCTLYLHIDSIADDVLFGSLGHPDWTINALLLANSTVGSTNFTSNPYNTYNKFHEWSQYATWGGQHIDTPEREALPFYSDKNPFLSTSVAGMESMLIGGISSDPVGWMILVGVRSPDLLATTVGNNLLHLIGGKYRETNSIRAKKIIYAMEGTGVDIKNNIGGQTFVKIKW